MIVICSLMTIDSPPAPSFAVVVDVLDGTGAFVVVVVVGDADRALVFVTGIDVVVVRSDCETDTPQPVKAITNTHLARSLTMAVPPIYAYPDVKEKST